MIAVVDYHKGNLKSVERGLIGVGGDARITDDAAAIAAARAIVLPGVGAFADAMESLRELGLADLLVERIEAGVPFLGICLGLQLLYEQGEEGAPAGETVAGLGVLPGTSRALPNVDAQGNRYKIPHVGWNSVEFVEAPSESAGADALPAACPLFAGIPEGEHFYFTHSFVAPASPFTVATTMHSITFPSAAQKGAACFGVQFHPEKSSDAGMQLLRNFADIVERA